MPALHSFDYGVLRIVPCQERGEFVNAGVVMHCPESGFLECRVHLDERRVLALWPDWISPWSGSTWRPSPESAPANPEAGPIARLSRRERFHWLVAPRSTILQVSPVHSGLCESPETTFEELFKRWC